MALICTGVASEERRFIAVTSGTKVLIAEEIERENREVRLVTLESVETPSGDGDCVVAMTTGGDTRRPLLAVCTSEKHLVLWECGEEREEWKRREERVVGKRVTGLQISDNGEYLLTADKTGSVTRYRVSDLVSGSSDDYDSGEEMMGHLSMILDMVIVSCDSHVITCDRDEKIRVSRYPNCYNIETFCLGHTEFVSSLCLCKKWPHLLISTSGDGTVRSWDWKNGTLLDIHDFSISSTSSSISTSSSSSSNTQRKEKLVAVTSAVCSQFTDPPLIVTTLEGASGVAVLQLFSDGRLQQSELLPLPVSPWSCVFDWSDRLWVCLPHEPEPVQCWSLVDGKFQRCNDLLQEELSHWNHFTDCREWRDWSSMRKNTTCDNMAGYLARKEERIRQRTTITQLEESINPGTDIKPRATVNPVSAISEEEEETLSQPPAEKRTKLQVN